MFDPAAAAMWRFLGIEKQSGAEFDAIPGWPAPQVEDDRDGDRQSTQQIQWEEKTHGCRGVEAAARLCHHFQPKTARYEAAESKIIAGPAGISME